MKRLIRKILSISILLVLFALLVDYTYNHLSDFKQITLINPLWFVVLILLFLLNYYFIGLQTKVLLEPLNIHLKELETYMLAVVTGFYNLITPARGGMGVRAVYLKKKHKFTYTNFLASLAGMYVITFFIGSLFGLISLYLINQTYGFFNWPILVVFLSLFLSLFAVIVFSPEFRETKYKFLNNFIRVANGWSIIRKNERIIRTCLLVTIYSLLSATMSLMLSYYLFGIKISFIQALFLASIASISLLIQITPAGLGINEAIAIFSAYIIGIMPVQAISVAILGRIVQMICLFTLGPWFSYKLLKYKNEKHSKR